ncbi:discoidin domain-containing protein [Streptomyces sp. NPDC048383]|uniref:discoidin domain-containing protein n=1 Tax=Streptomyces sp. NPDC048383 TaxID=3155386 RepID=UPI003412F617
MGRLPCTPQLATDRRTDTRWAGTWADPQWLQVDLGSVRQLRHARLVWGSAYGKRWVRLELTERGSGYGYSLFHFGVHA